MLQALTLLFVCQLVGEVVVRLLGLTFPGPVLGMALLFSLLLWRGGPGKDLEAATSGILGNLSLLYAPAAVGIMQQLGLIGANWFAILVSVVISTLLTLVVSVYTFRGVARIGNGRGRP